MTSVHSTISPPQEDANVTNERQIVSDILKETIKYFHGLTIQSTISDSAYYDSEEHDAISNPKSDLLVATHTSIGNKRKITDNDTTNGNSPHKLILNRLIPKIIPGTIRTIYQIITEDVARIGDTSDARQTVLSKDIVTDAACSGAHIFRTTREESRTGRDGTTPQDRNIVIATASLTSPIQICHSTTYSPSRNRNQDIINLIGHVSPQWIRNAKKLKTSIDGFFAEDRVNKPIFSKVVGCSFAFDFSANANLRCGMNFRSNDVLTQNPNFITLRIASVNAMDKLGYVSVRTTSVRS